MRILFGSSRRHRRHGLGRPDGSDDLKSMGDLHDAADQFDYPISGSGCGGDQLRSGVVAKHYVMPDYSLRKDYVIGATADVLATLQGYETTTAAAVTGPPGNTGVMLTGGVGMNEYPTESRMQQRAPTGSASTMTMQTPRIHYHHVYESPQFT